MTARLPLTRLATTALPRRLTTSATAAASTSSPISKLTGTNALLSGPIARVARSGSSASRSGLVGGQKSQRRWATAEAGGEGQTMVSVFSIPSLLLFFLLLGWL